MLLHLIEFHPLDGIKQVFLAKSQHLSAEGIQLTKGRAIAGHPAHQTVNQDFGIHHAEFLAGEGSDYPAACWSKILQTIRPEATPVTPFSEKTPAGLPRTPSRSFGHRQHWRSGTEYQNGNRRIEPPIRRRETIPDGASWALRSSDAGYPAGQTGKSGIQPRHWCSYDHLSHFPQMHMAGLLVRFQMANLRYSQLRRLQSQWPMQCRQLRQRVGSLGIRQQVISLLVEGYARAFTLLTLFLVKTILEIENNQQMTLF